jgi:hypothetical protein
LILIIHALILAVDLVKKVGVSQSAVVLEMVAAIVATPDHKLLAVKLYLAAEVEVDGPAVMMDAVALVDVELEGVDQVDGEDHGVVAEDVDAKDLVYVALILVFLAPMDMLVLMFVDPNLDAVVVNVAVAAVVVAKTLNCASQVLTAVMVSKKFGSVESPVYVVLPHLAQILCLHMLTLVPILGQRTFLI